MSVVCASVTSPALRSASPSPSHSSTSLPTILCSPFSPPQTSHRPLPLRPSLHFLTHYVSLENFLLCSICPFPTSPTPFQQTHPLNGCSPYRHAGPGVLSLPRLNSRGRVRPPHTLLWTFCAYWPLYKQLLIKKFKKSIITIMGINQLCTESVSIHACQEVRV